MCSQNSTWLGQLKFSLGGALSSPNGRLPLFWLCTCGRWYGAHIVMNCISSNSMVPSFRSGIGCIGAMADYVGDRAISTAPFHSLRLRRRQRSATRWLNETQDGSPGLPLAPASLRTGYWIFQITFLPVH